LFRAERSKIENADEVCDRMNINDAQHKAQTAITLRHHIFIAMWVILIFLLFIVSTSNIISDIHQHKSHGQQGWREGEGIYSPFGNSSEKMPSNSNEKNPSSIGVLTGMYVGRISDFSMKDSSWTVDFCIWFKWNDSNAYGSTVDPGNNMGVSNGQILWKQKQYELVNGSNHYVQYEVLAKITKLFDTSLFPFDSHLLLIQIEDTVDFTDELQYIPENYNSNITSDLFIPGYRIIGFNTSVNNNTYETNWGDPQEAGKNETFYSQYNFGIWISRPGWGFYFKIFEGLFIAVAVSIITLFIRPIHTGPRFVLGVGALFAAVANYYNIYSMQPGIEIMTLADLINFLGTITIFLTIVQSTISLYLYDSRGQKALSQMFDRVSVIIFIIFYISINLSIIITAIY